MIAKTESSVFLTGRSAKPAFNSRNFSFTCHTHSVWRRVFGDSSPGIVPWNGCAWHCDAFQAFMHMYIHTYIHTRACIYRRIYTHRSVEARHRHTDTDVEWRRARESRRRDLLNRRFKMLKYRRVVAARESTQLPQPLDVSSFGPT